METLVVRVGHTGRIVMFVDGGSQARRVIVAVPAADGDAYAEQILRRLRDLGIETHLIVGEEVHVDLDSAADRISSIEDLADHVHQPSNLAARPSSGSFSVSGMIIVPCTPSVAETIARGVGGDLIHRAADVTIKEGRPLALLVLDEMSPPAAHDNLRKLEGIRGVSVVQPNEHGGDEEAETSEATIERLIAALGIDREG